MTGLQGSYDASNADFIIHGFGGNPWQILMGWLPANPHLLSDIPVFVTIPSGGWDGPHSVSHAAVFEPYTGQLGGTLVNDMISAGWCIVQMEMVPGLNVVDNNRAHPCSTWVEITRALAEGIQFLKTQGGLGKLTGKRSATLATDESRYVVQTSSSSSDSFLWVALQPDGTLPYNNTFINVGADDPWTYQHNHRVKGVVLNGALPDFSKLNSSSISSSAVPYQFAREAAYSSPAYAWCDPWRKRAASTIQLLDAGFAENQHLGLFVTADLDSTNAEGSYLGSGTCISFSGSVSGGAIAVGDIATETLSGTVGTVVGFNFTTYGGVKIVFIERSRGGADYTNASWTASTKTITSAGAFRGYTYTSGDVTTIPGSGGGWTPGTYAIASKVSDDAIVLSAAAGQPVGDDQTSGVGFGHTSGTILHYTVGGTVQKQGGGWSFTADIQTRGNDSQLKFLSAKDDDASTDALKLWDNATAIEGELVDYQDGHDVVGAAAIRRSLLRKKANPLNVYRFGNNYVASLDDIDPGYRYSGRDYSTDVRDWAFDTLWIS